MNKPRNFEEFVAKHFKDKGYTVTLTPHSGDYGVDVFAEKAKTKIAIQVKMYGETARKVNRKSVMELHGAKDYFDCNKAIIATNGKILDDALDVAKKLNIEILNLKYQHNLVEDSASKDIKTFEDAWLKYVFPLKGQELIRDDGSKNTIIDVDWSCVKRRSSTGNIGTINIEIFKEAYNLLVRNGQVSRDYINQNSPGRASSGVILILSKVPFIELKKNPIRLVYKNFEDETAYLLKSPANAKRLLKSIKD